MLSKFVRVAALLGSLHAQSVIPAKAGLVSYAEEAYVDGHLVTPTEFFVVNENSVLRAAGGRAEVLLGPCAVAWLDEGGSLRMLANRLNDTRIELLNGRLLVAVGEKTKIGLRLGITAIPVDRNGAYELDASPAQAKVLTGRLTIHGGSLAPGRSLQLDEGRVSRFDTNSGDPFESWSNARAALMVRLSRPSNPPGDTPKIEDTKSTTDRIRLAERSGPMRTVSGAPPANGTRPEGCSVEPWKR